MNNNEKELIVTKIEKYSEEIKESSGKMVSNAIYVGASALISVNLIQNAIFSGNLNAIPVLVPVGVGVTLFCARNIAKQMARQMNLKEEIVDYVMDHSLQSNNQEIENKGKSR